MSTNSFNFGQSLVKESGWWEDFKAKKGVDTSKPKIKVVGPETTTKKAEWSSWKSGVGPSTYPSDEEVAKWHKKLKAALGQDKQAGLGSMAWEGAKFIPGAGAVPSFIDAGRAAMQGNWGTALGEGAMGALSLIPGGTVARGLAGAGKLAGKGLGMAGKVGLAGAEAAGKAGVQAVGAMGKMAPGVGRAMQNSGGMMGNIAKDVGNFAGKIGQGAPGMAGAVGNAGRQASGFAQKIPGMASSAGNAASSFAKGIPNRMTGSLATGVNKLGRGIQGFAPNTGAAMAGNSADMARNMMGAAPKLGLQVGVSNTNQNTRDNFYNSPRYKFNQPRYY